MKSGLRNITGKTFIALTLLAFCGCERTRSLMNMNSNSGVPFFGLEFAVDASDVQKSQLRETAPINVRTNPAIEEVTLASTDEPASGVQYTSDSGAAGSVNYPLTPQEQTAEVEAILGRL